MANYDGFIEKWYLDGNFVRTALLYAFYKTHGVRVAPWREDVRLGAVTDQTKETLYLYLSAEEDWTGKLYFDAPRHQTIWQMPDEYPRLNQLPEWYTIDPDSTYQLLTNRGESYTFIGQDLINGIPWTISAQEGQQIQLTKSNTP